MGKRVWALRLRDMHISNLVSSSIIFSFKLKFLLKNQWPVETTWANLVPLWSVFFECAHSTQHFVFNFFLNNRGILYTQWRQCFQRLAYLIRLNIFLVNFCVTSTSMSSAYGCTCQNCAISLCTGGTSAGPCVEGKTEKRPEKSGRLNLITLAHV